MWGMSPIGDGSGMEDWTSVFVQGDLFRMSKSGFCLLVSFYRVIILECQQVGFEYLRFSIGGLLQGFVVRLQIRGDNF